jgi:Uma2 family endonuclease
MAASPTPHLFTVHDYHKMAEVGVLSEDDRVELIDGEIVEMPPIGAGHAGNVNWFTDVFSRLFGGRGQLSIQNPVRLGLRVEPRPDVMLLRLRDDYYRAHIPEPEDVLLIVEVADSSLNYDRRTKCRLYARAGLADYWIVNLVDEAIEVYRDPLRATYRSIRTFRRGDALSPLAFPDISIAVSDVLGPGAEQA